MHPPARALTVAFVPGVMPGKWLARWRQRRPEVPLDSFQYDGGSLVPLLREGGADIGFVRLPVEREGLSVIPLYEEQPVVVAPKEHEVLLYDEVPLEDLAGETLLDVGACGGPRMAIEVAASGAGLAILPMPLARLYSRKDVVWRPVTGMDGTRIAVAWLAAETSEDVEEFIGIVRGRTERSSRQPSARQEEPARRPAGGAASKPPRKSPAQGSGRPSRTGRKLAPGASGKPGRRGGRRHR